MFKTSWPLAMLAVSLTASRACARTRDCRQSFFSGHARHRRSRRQRRTGAANDLVSKTGDDPSFKQLDISGEFAKRITEDFAISVAPTWSRLYAPGGPTMTGARGFQNLETTFKYRLFKNAEHEFVMSAGLEIEWGGSGAQGAGAERFNVYTPTLYFGKGFGDLPSSLNWARPFAITGQIGYAIPGYQRSRLRRRSRHRRAGHRHRVQSARA